MTVGSFNQEVSGVSQELLQGGERKRSYRQGLCIGLISGLAVGVVSCLIVVSVLPNRPDVLQPKWSGQVGAAPLIPTMCNTLATSSAPLAVLVEVDGQPYAMVPDTGSSNFNLASSRCRENCDVHPKWTSKQLLRGGQYFDVVYGTGGAVITLDTADISLGGVKLKKGSFGAIVDQYAGADGFNLFPAASDPICYNSFAGILGLAYRRQDAGPDDDKSNSNGTTNGTSVPLLDQFTQTAGMPNAFAMEICERYPMPCGPRTDLSTWTPSRPCDMNFNVGNLLLGGYRSSSLASEMRYTPITDEIHYDLELLGMQVCGEKGCKDVKFPDKIGGRTEHDCVCDSVDCAIPLSPNEYCYFTVIDSGADGIYMNTLNNTIALLTAMEDVDMVLFPSGSDWQSTTSKNDFYRKRSPVLGARPSPKSSFTMFFPDMDGKRFGHRLSIGAVFRQTMAGLVQVGIHGELEAAKQFQAAKFPVLLGTAFMIDKVVFFDRSRKRIGLADVKPSVCGTPILSEDEIDVLGLDIETPGTGCRRGTGSGGGCPQAQKPIFQTKNF
eukprot:TRINITY_DN11057_c1_g1_i1.p1 TRINITY_DN11057_c1_g1~~TRINITY_DN11057_c1_g1_i1.p1  ORF type:complete len:552 (-),score=53.37 TRINITY_DN11057_c1_g1_i1:77-1732(-)